MASLGHGLFGGGGPQKGPNHPKTVRRPCQSPKINRGALWDLYKHICRWVEHFQNFDFFNLYRNLPLHPPFWPFRSILVPFWIKNGTILAFFSQGPITFDRLFKKIPRVPAEPTLGLSYITTFFEQPIKNPDFLTLVHKGILRRCVFPSWGWVWSMSTPECRSFLSATVLGSGPHFSSWRPRCTGTAPTCGGGGQFYSMIARWLMVMEGVWRVRTENRE